MVAYARAFYSFEVWRSLYSRRIESLWTFCFGLSHNGFRGKVEKNVSKCWNAIGHRWNDERLENAESRLISRAQFPLLANKWFSFRFVSFHLKWASWRLVKYRQSVDLVARRDLCSKRIFKAKWRNEENRKCSAPFAACIDSSIECEYQMNTKSEIQIIRYSECRARRRRSKWILFFFFAGALSTRAIDHQNSSFPFRALFDSALYRLFFDCVVFFLFFFSSFPSNIRGFTWIDRCDDNNEKNKRRVSVNTVCVCVQQLSHVVFVYTVCAVRDYNFLVLEIYLIFTRRVFCISNFLLCLPIFFFWSRSPQPSWYF